MEPSIADEPIGPLTASDADRVLKTLRALQSQQRAYVFGWLLVGVMALGIIALLYWLLQPVGNLFIYVSAFGLFLIYPFGELAGRAWVFRRLRGEREEDFVRELDWMLSGLSAAGVCKRWPAFADAWFRCLLEHSDDEAIQMVVRDAMQAQWQSGSESD